MCSEVHVSAFAIRTRGLGLRFQTVQALEDVSFEVPEGTIFGLLGPNGAGKTTMIRVLLGLLEPTAGTAEVLGHDVVADPTAIRERTGALLEHCGLYERLSAQDNLELFGRISRMPADARRARVRDLLERLNLWNRRRDLVGMWSRGMKQRLAIARALMAHPALVFLDEPTAGLDPLAANDLRDELATLVRDERVTLFLTTHNLVEAERLCDRIGVMHKGRLLATGSPDDIIASARSLEDAFVRLVEAAC